MESFGESHASLVNVVSPGDKRLSQASRFLARG